MRKRNQDKLFDNIMWYIIYLLPIIITFLFSIGAFKGFTYADWEVMWENDIYISDLPLVKVFDSVIAMFIDEGSIFMETISSFMMGLGIYSYAVCAYMTYFIGVYICHIAVDILLFIPRLAHKWMNAFTKEC